jgi:hypothetical protein
MDRNGWLSVLPRDEVIVYIHVSYQQRGATKLKRRDISPVKSCNEQISWLLRYRFIDEKR